GVIGADRTPVFFARHSGRSHHNLRRSLRTALADPRQPSAAESWLLVSTARTHFGLSSDCVRQDLSPEPCPSRNANLGAQPRSNTENCTGQHQRQNPLSAKGCVNPLGKARRCRRRFIGNRVADNAPALDPESLRDRGQRARSTRSTRRRSSTPSGTASRGSPPVWRHRPSNRTERATTFAAGACGA
ncbi:MAG: hypothetical protein XXXNARYT_003653, partial [Candidatus Accumulibacter regalis]